MGRAPCCNCVGLGAYWFLKRCLEMMCLMADFLYTHDCHGNVAVTAPQFNLQQEVIKTQLFLTVHVLLNSFIPWENEEHARYLEIGLGKCILKPIFMSSSHWFPNLVGYENSEQTWCNTILCADDESFMFPNPSQRESIGLSCQTCLICFELFNRTAVGQWMSKLYLFSPHLCDCIASSPTNGPKTATLFESEIFFFQLTF